METIKSIIKKIDRVIPLKETAVSLLVCFIVLILIEYIWDDSVADFLNMNHLIVAAVLLAYLIVVIILIKYIMRSRRVRQNNIRSLRDRVLEEQAGRSDTVKTVIKTVLILLIIFPIILLTLIAVETIWEGSVSYYINLSALVISTIATEVIAILAILIILGRQRLNNKMNILRPAAKAIKLKEPVWEETPSLETPLLEKTNGLLKVARRIFLIAFICILLALVVEAIWVGSVSHYINLNYLIVGAIILGTYVLWSKRRVLDLKSEAVQEEQNAIKKRAEFAGKFPSIIRLPIIRHFIRWMYTEGWGYSIALVVLVLIGFYIRIYSLGTQPFWVDETISTVTSSSILTHGFPILPSGAIYDSAPLDQYIRAASFGILGINNFSARLPAVIFGVIVIPVAYLLGKRIGNKNVGLIAALLVTFCTEEIAWARQAKNYQQFQFFYILSLYLFLKTIDRKRKRDFFVLLLVIVAAFMSNVLAGILFVIFGLYIIIFEHRRLVSLLQHIRRHPIKTAVIIIFIICLVMVISLIYDIKSVLGFSSITVHFVNNQSLYLNYLQDISLLVFLFFWIGLIALLKRREGFVLVAATVIPWLFLFYLYEVVWFQYIYFTLPLFFITASSCIVLFAKLVTKTIKLPRRVSYKIAHAVLIFILIYLSLNAPLLADKKTSTEFSFTFIPQSTYNIPRLPQTNFEGAYNYLLSQYNNSEVVISLTTGLIPAYYYLGDHFSTETNYCFCDRPWLNWAYKAYQEDQQWFEGYTGAPLITSKDELREVIESYPRGWLIIDYQKTTYLNESDYDYINANMEYHEAGSDETIKVYSWDRE